MIDLRSRNLPIQQYVHSFRAVAAPIVADRQIAAVVIEITAQDSKLARKTRRILENRADVHPGNRLQLVPVARKVVAVEGGGQVVGIGRLDKMP